MASADSIRARQDWTTEYGRRGAGAVNVGETERLASKIGGGVLMGVGLVRGGLGGLVLAGLGGALLYRGSTGHCPLYGAIGASTDYEPGPSDAVPAQAGVRVEEAITINRPAADLYHFWRDHGNLTKFQTYVESVTSPDNVRSHWVLRGPMGATLEWDAEIFEDKPGELIAWRSLDGGSVDTAGSVRFTPAPGGRGTEVRVNQKFNPPGGKLGIVVAKLFGQNPESLTRESLRRLKQLMEAGEIPTIAGQPSGRGRDA